MAILQSGTATQKWRALFTLSFGTFFFSCLLSEPELENNEMGTKLMQMKGEIMGQILRQKLVFELL